MTIENALPRIDDVAARNMTGASPLETGPARLMQGRGRLSGLESLIITAIYSMVGVGAVKILINGSGTLTVSFGPKFAASGAALC
ncbi:hypothetical protein EBZ80_00160 [bacterium]|nr:hypothetical protein [bacterium]